MLIDRDVGVKHCAECGGRGVTIRTVRMGPMVQQLQEACGYCDGKGVTYKQTRVKEVVEVHIPKGCPDGHKMTFYEKADEIPDGITGDLVIVLQEQKHEEFERHGADLYISRNISLVEALCGFKMEITHLDKRKLLVHTNPGEVIKPVLFDPLNDSQDTQWETYADSDCPNLTPVARADLDDVEKCQQVVSKGQLKGKGIGAFSTTNGKTTFFKCSREEAIEDKAKSKGSTLYVLADPAADAANRMMKAVKGEGLPVHKDVMLSGNLFIRLNIEFPDAIDPSQVAALKKALPPPKQECKISLDDPQYEVFPLEATDPVESYKSTAPTTDGDATMEDEQEGGGGQRVQCAQQ